MSQLSTLKPHSIHIAIMALGGQGGGVLVDWIVRLAEHAGWTAQATSVAGVAQRTGATIYYIELVEPTPGQAPVLALMAVPGDVDVLIAAELMEAGRAVERGLVTPGRTTVIASSHRVFAIQEKMVSGNGIADSAQVLDIVRREARHLVMADMQALAAGQGSVISASLFGALAGSGALPFALAEFEAVVERSGVGVKPSLAALRAGAAVARSAAPPDPPADPMHTAPRPLPATAASAQLQPLLERIRAAFPRPAWDWLGEGLARVVDYQDAAYGGEYLDHVARLLAADPDADAADGQVAIEAARWVAVAMSYDDVIRVADLKTRAERSARLRREVAAGADDVVGSEEYFHPRMEEVMGLLPRRLADWLDGSPRLRDWLASRLSRGRRIRTHTLRGHLQLHLVAGLRRWRRSSRRHAEELGHLQAWLAEVQQVLPHDRALALELLRCRRLVKGYSDTHARGSSRFDRLLRAARELRGRADAGPALGALREAALRDAEGQALSQRLQTLGLAP
ncbi:indolepyruvate oxidoreductase subunit beta family protein [Verminephrobacter eiseniae]|uniref:Indolepyruvate ferredoxin oxidoreductase beta subunit n=2 Tax=Verminephrobacter eiseniae TaxID=364317 RepID=A1WJB1_VEREI|nr:indolepyruvate oxidoreductase subunit beta family protein [Verminephrobacter eiseniae]ABM57718.1 indolepyruvate ferredoxin oxidoreductase beta subunit [Verminephrobacter eiseniae EF01-2]MCW5262912.1 indolepyruvate oxidoreductase subunit beta family protein [Verminephrobacter eiseniae]MCW5283335.1 indolepyruvate oxidoreductase subunit beta family protein [Verminephrobacter eiseniae]MCW5303652.1 indolepyruvate oxidoreductase subunit beta family protein [Verminephrobacter eiseniae]MCW8188446.1